MHIIGDQAFLSENNSERLPEMTYAGALSFLRRRYSRDLEGADVVVSGIPFDCSVTNRPGCRFGPRSIRQASTQLAELKAFPSGFEIFKHLNVIDWGDCVVNPHDPESINQTILDHAELIISKGVKMLTLGGDHWVTYPLLKAHAKKYGPIALLQFDAHSDTWEDDGKRLDHGTMFSRAVKEGIIDVKHSTQIGIRTHNDFSLGFEILSAPWFHRNGVEKSLDIICDRVKNKPLYISFDIDVLDLSFAPGTGTPVVGGLATWQALELVRGLGSCNLIGLDIVEVSPPFDHAEISALAGATVAHDWLALLAGQAGAKKHLVGRL